MLEVAMVHTARRAQEFARIALEEHERHMVARTGMTPAAITLASK